MGGTGLEVFGGIFKIDAAAKLHSVGVGGQGLQHLFLVIGTQGDHMAAGKLVLSVELGVIGSVLGADKVGICTAIGKTATDNLLYLTLVKINTGAKCSHRANSGYISVNSRKKPQYN